MGEPGVGKSVFASQCTVEFPSLIVAQHFVRYDNAESRQARRLVRSVAHQLCRVLPSYRKHLLSMVLPQLPADEKLGASDLWGRLLAAPLKECFGDSEVSPAELQRNAGPASSGATASAASSPAPRVVILIDALDEAEGDLLPLLSSELKALPAWLSLLLTSRPEQAIRTALERHKPYELHCDTEENQTDIELFLREQLSAAPATAPSVDALVPALLATIKGQFLYARLLCDAVIDDPQCDLTKLPVDLTAWYQQSVQRLKDSSGARWRQLLAMIEAVCTFYAPPSLELLGEYVHRRCAPTLAEGAVSASAGAVVVDLSEPDSRPALLRQLLAPLSALFPLNTATGTVSVYHKSVSDFFTDARRREEEPDSTVNLQTAHQLIAEIALQQMRTSKSAQPKAKKKAAQNQAGDAAAAASPEDPTADSDITMPAFVRAPQLPWLPLLKVTAAVTDSARAAKNLPPESSAAWLRYGACYAAEHAAAACSVPLLVECLCHPQYLHLRALYQRHCSRLTDEYAQAIQLAEEERRRKEADEEEDSEADQDDDDEKQGEAKQRPPSLSALRLSVQLQCLYAFERLYLQHGRRWSELPELVYQYALSYPGHLPPSPLAQQLLSWFNGWKHRTTAVIRWENKPQQLGDLIGMLSGHNDVVTSIAFSSDGSRIVSGGRDCTVRLWSAVDLTELKVLEGHRLSVTSVAFSPDGSRIVSSSYDRTIRVWDAVNFVLCATLQGHAAVNVRAVTFSPSGMRIVSGGHIFAVQMWNAATQTPPEGELKGHIGGVGAVAFSSDSSRLAGCSGNGTLWLWDVQQLREISPAAPSEQIRQPRCVAFSPNDSRLLIGFAGGVRVWDAATLQLLREVECDSCINAVAFNPNGTRFVSGGDDSTVQVWDVSTGELLKSFIGHHGRVNAVAFSPDGSRIVSGGENRSLCVWDARDLSQSTQRAGLFAAVTCVALSPDGRLIASGSSDHTIRLWDAFTGAKLAVLSGHSGRLNSVAFNHDGVRLVSAAEDGTARVWDTLARTEIKCLEGHAWAARRAAFSPDGTRIVSCDNNDIVLLWDAHSFKLLEKIKEKQRYAYLTWSPDSQRIVGVSSGQGELYVLNVEDMRLKKFEGPEGFVTSVTFSHDGSRLASGSYDGIVQVWDAAEAIQIAKLEGHKGIVKSVAWSANGKWIVSGSEDGTVRVWDADSLHQVRVLGGHSGVVHSVAVNYDGSRIVSGSEDRSVRVWSLCAESGATANVIREFHLAIDDHGSVLHLLTQLC